MPNLFGKEILILYTQHQKKINIHPASTRIPCTHVVLLTILTQKSLLKLVSQFTKKYVYIGQTGQRNWLKSEQNAANTALKSGHFNNPPFSKRQGEKGLGGIILIRDRE